jgi:hypothetical protein
MLQGELLIRMLFDWLVTGQISTLVGLRDRALISLMTFALARGRRHAGRGRLAQGHAPVGPPA